MEVIHVKGQPKSWLPEKVGEVEFAPGIPAHKKIQPIPILKEPKTWHLVVQAHPAEIAGDHKDVRLVDPATGFAHSWATKKELPKPGDRSITIFQQPTHTEEYARSFQDEIKSGYGKTRKGLKVTKVVDHPVEVLQADPNFLRFNTYEGQSPQEFILTKAKEEKNKPWHLINVTKTRARLPSALSFSKPKYKEMAPGAIDLSNDAQVMATKIDGAHNIFVLDKDRRPRVFSYREPKKQVAGVIEHSQKLKLYASIVPKAVDKTILRGELYAQSKGKPVPAETVAGMINANVWTSREKQKEHGHLRPAIFDVVQFRGKDMTGSSYGEKLKALQEVQKHMPGFEIPELAFTEGEKKELLRRIKKKEHPETHEGVILWHRDEPRPPIKAKFKKEHDVFVRNIFQAVDKNGKLKDEAGGFEYSHSLTGPIVGRIGTGFSRELKQDMHRRPEVYLGANARVTSLAEYKSGALGKAAFQGWHPDKTPQEFWEKNPVQKIAANPILAESRWKDRPKLLEEAMRSEVPLHIPKEYAVRGTKAQRGFGLLHPHVDIGFRHKATGEDPGDSLAGWAMGKSEMSASLQKKMFRKQWDVVVDTLYLKKKHQGKGLGSGTFQGIVAGAKRLGAHNIQLTADDVGRHAWSRVKGIEFADNDQRGTTYSDYKRWRQRTGRGPELHPDAKPHQYPKEFLLDEENHSGVMGMISYKIPLKKGKGPVDWKAVGAAGIGIAGAGLVAHKLLKMGSVKPPGLVPKSRLLTSKEKTEALDKADQHFGSADSKKWDQFLNDAQRKSFAGVIAKDPRSDTKLIRYVDQMNRLITGKRVGEVRSSGTTYSIIRKRGGGLSCTCPDWRYRRSVSDEGAQTCKHIREYNQRKTLRTRP